MDELPSLPPAIAYVGFSMGTIFGIPTVAAIPTIAATVFVVGGIPGGHWTDDDDLEPRLLAAADRLGGAHVQMLNKEEDELFDAKDVRRLFTAVLAQSKTLRFFPGGHDEWGQDLIDDSICFLAEHIN